MNSHLAGCSAPKFASFKPKPSSTTPTLTSKEKEKSHRKEDNDREHRREEKWQYRSRSPDREKKRHRRDQSRTRNRERHSRSRSPRRDRSRESHNRIRGRDRKDRHDYEVEHHQSRTQPLAPAIVPWDGNNQVFIPDRIGDKHILSYRSLHRGDVPRYRRTGYGYVLGLPQDFRIDRDASDEKRIILRSKFGDSNDGSSSGSVLGLVRPTPSEDRRPILPGSRHHEVEDFALDYMQLNPGKKRKRSSVTPRSTDAEVDYRSIEGKAKENPIAEDSDFEYASSDDKEGADVRARTIELSRHVKAEPQSLKAWRELIVHQEAVLRANRQNLTFDGRLSAAEVRSLAEVRLSIYNDALNKITNGRDCEDLLLEMMAEAELVCEEKRLEEKWEYILRDHPGSTLLWKGYLDHVQAAFKNFTYSRGLNIFKRCLRILSKAPPVPENVEMQAYIFTRATVFIRESGFNEFAVALWQAMLELHLFKTPRPMDEGERLKLFEEFWDAEVPRIGEDDAQGWTNHAITGGEPIDPIKINMSLTIEPKNCFRQFAEAEPHVGEKLRWPGRAADETGDDPYHMIMFSDIQEWLEVLPLEIPVKVLMHAFLLCNGLPPLALVSIGDTLRWWTDSFLDFSYLDMEHHATMLAAKGVSDGYKLWNGVMTPEGLFGSAFPSRLTDDPELSVWIHRILDVFRNAALQNEAFAEYYLAYTTQNYPNTVSKAGKALLKANQTSLRLYNAYALAEKKTGKPSKADSVHEAALSMAHNLPQHAQADIPLAWHSYVWTAIELGNTSLAYKRVVLGPNALNTSGELESSSFLKARRTFTEGFKNNLSQNSAQATYYSALLALLVYLPGSDISAALDVFHFSAIEISGSMRQSEQGDRKRSMHEELLCQFKAQLLRFHTEHHAFKPNLLRRSLQQDLSLFPENTILLDLWKFNESKFGIEDRLRGSLAIITASKDASFLRLLWDIQREIDRWETGSGTMHSVSASFERAVSRGGKNSVTIWTQYVLFLWNTENMQQAKKVFLLGLTHLPWAKRFLLLAFSHLRNVLSYEELKGLYNVLHEKELRVHVDLSGVFNDIDAGQRKLAQRAR